MRNAPSILVRTAALVFACAGLSLSAQATQAAAPLPAVQGLVLRTALDVVAEYTYRSADELVEPYTVKNGIDFTNNYLDAPPLARLSLDLGSIYGLSLGFSVDVRRQFGPSYEGYFPTSNLPVGFSNGASYIPPSNNAISRGVISWTSPALDLSIGRDKVDYGGFVQGSIFPSDRLPYLDALRARAGSVRSLSIT